MPQISQIEWGIRWGLARMRCVGTPRACVSACRHKSRQYVTQLAKETSSKLKEASEGPRCRSQRKQQALALAPAS